MSTQKFFLKIRKRHFAKLFPWEWFAAIKLYKAKIFPRCIRKAEFESHISAFSPTEKAGSQCSQTQEKQAQLKPGEKIGWKTCSKD